MTIGQFARRTRLSYKALRMYDAMELLPPAFVDADSRYRYYGEDQVEQARLIGLLRRLEMPLERVREVLGQPRDRAFAAVDAYRREREAEVRVQRRLVAFLEAFLEGREGTVFEIQTRSVPEQRVATLRSHVHADELPGFIGDAMHRLYAHLKEAGAAPEGYPFVAYHGQVDFDSDGPVEVCVPFAGSLDPEGDVALRVEPAHEQAFARVTKAQVAFPTILEAYAAVETHLRERGARVAGSPREVYIAPWDEIGDDDTACDVAFPFTE